MNVTVIPRSRDPRHILLNFKALEMELSEDEIKIITEEWLPSSSKDADTTEQESESLETSDGEPESLDAREEDDGNDYYGTSDRSKDEL